MTTRRPAVFPPLRAILLALVALAEAVLPTAAEAGEDDRPNILFAIADDWSADHASIAGCSWVKTPAFDRVCREGVRFTNAFTSNPKCSPCRASILTGRNSWQLEEAANHFGLFPAKWPVYPDLLESAGYHVGSTGKGWGPGDFQAGGFSRNPAGPNYSRHRARPPFSGISNIDYARNFEAFLDDRDDGQPFCFWYGATEPHRSYEEGSGLRAGRDPKAVQVPSYYPDSPAIRSDLLDYALEVEWFDEHLGRMIDHLDAIGELDNTIILVTSDHGMPFPRVKGQIYEHGFHLPLAVRWGAKAPPGRVVDDFINVRDFAPTFLQAAGVPVPESVTGRGFLDLLTGTGPSPIDPPRDRMLVGKERHDLGRPLDAGYPVRALRTPEYLYIHNYEPDRWPAGNPETNYPNVDNSPTKTLLTSRFDDFYRLSFGKRPREELYRVSDDPDCVQNLAADPDHRALKERLRDEMEAMLRDEGDPRMIGMGWIFDSYEYVGSRNHSYDAWLRHHR
ncbi:sulfatase family protein [Tautonia sociabilis]|uniref:Heparan N-sulfatase n=1 Tax=Tautonia sociabilis TaxID=2080755 RepID=A0A432MFP8_9BACT|nr:sulfatase [Tautonia sociabilis]RUL85047.1 heparan N-sulfatase [Tautonia sociabilis]